ncbi:MAG TPA: KpsF/GutQ family sugar-phosphate isomerase [Candidatus Acidoferrales bacterium]|nr:KpsF/GutQ family sugar-phosphate isomerase [Candidatus Acidoferrales bacterium]
MRRARGSDDLRRARRVLAIEAGAIAALADRLDERFDRAVETLAGCRGKVVVMGMGKSGIICRKIAATFTSTGTPAVFLHAAEAAHGDAGVFVKGDVVLALSSSGETEEVVRLLPLIKRLRAPLIALTGNLKSPLARAADVVLDVSVAEEACSLGLAPTASTTAALALGDALAVALLERKGFGASDFAVLHPAGALGRRFLKVDDLMHRDGELPVVDLDTPFTRTLLEITSKRLGVTAVMAKDGTLAGVITDGDLRRALERGGDLRASHASDLMTKNPKTIGATALAEEALAEMERYSITSLVILDPGRRPIGVIHLHDLLKAGVV